MSQDPVKKMKEIYFNGGKEIKKAKPVSQKDTDYDYGVLNFLMSGASYSLFGYSLYKYMTIEK